MKREVDAGNWVAVVVSVMAGAANQLVAWCQDCRCCMTREYDTAVATGEQVTTACLRSLQETASRRVRRLADRHRTDNAHGKARIGHRWRRTDPAQTWDRSPWYLASRIGPDNASQRSAAGVDTSAVALAAALHADRCDIYTDVDGIYTLIRDRAKGP